MKEVHQALNEVRQLYEQFAGMPAPDVSPGSYVSFPPGVDPVKHAVDEVEQLKRISRQIETAPAPVAWAPRADTYGTRDGLLIRLEIPGIDRESLKVFVTAGECVVRGERRTAKGEEELRPLALERPWGTFERRFPLPVASNPERITARYRDGILELRVSGESTGIPGEMTVEVE